MLICSRSLERGKSLGEIWVHFARVDAIAARRIGSVVEESKGKRERERGNERGRGRGKERRRGRDDAEKRRGEGRASPFCALCIVLVLVLVCPTFVDAPPRGGLRIPVHVPLSTRSMHAVHSVHSMHSSSILTADPSFCALQQQNGASDSGRAVRHRRRPRREPGPGGAGLPGAAERPLCGGPVHEAPLPDRGGLAPAGAWPARALADTHTHTHTHTHVHEHAHARCRASRASWTPWSMA